MQKRMKSAHPRTPGGRYADGSSANPKQTWKNAHFTPARTPKKAAPKALAPLPPTGEAGNA